MDKLLKEIFDYKEEKRQLLYILFFFFIGAFLVVHGFSVYHGGSLYVRGYQIHHFYFGMLVLSIGGVVGTLNKKRRPLQVASALMGVGIGLFADEIGLLLNCTTQTQAHPCIYAFADTLDFIGIIALAILGVVVLIGIVEKALGRKKSLGGSVTVVVEVEPEVR